MKELSKSRYTSFCQCPKMLWLKTYIFRNLFLKTRHYKPDLKKATRLVSLRKRFSATLWTLPQNAKTAASTSE